jgi:RNA polymerase sigma factor (sigma-70 family)
MDTPGKTPGRRKGRYLVAMVLGTALSALGSPGLSEAQAKTVNNLSRYCTACWRNARLDPGCWTDCTQEVFCRLLQRVTPEAWDRLLQEEGEERREFLRAIDTVKKRSQRTRKLAAVYDDTVADRRSLHEQQLREEREAVSIAAAQLLSPRQRSILQLSFEGWSVHDISSKLKVSPERVSDEKYKAIRKLQGHFTPSERDSGMVGA